MQTSEPFENDIDWLLNNLPDATDDEQEAFAERVAILILDAKFDENIARIEALDRTVANRKSIKYERVQ